MDGGWWRVEGPDGSSRIGPPWSRHPSPSRALYPLIRPVPPPVTLPVPIPWPVVVAPLAARGASGLAKSSAPGREFASSNRPARGPPGAELKNRRGSRTGA
jgi:hypothetical protein